MRLAHLLVAHVSSNLANHLSLKSVAPFATEETSYYTGCHFTGMNSIYQCTPEFSDAKDIYTPPVLRFRADCRGAGGNFQNLTLFDGSRVCGQLSYRKYGNSSDIVSPTTRWLPLTYDYIVTMEKEDILDIECVPYHLRFGMSLSRVKESVGHVKAESWMLPLAFWWMVISRFTISSSRFRQICCSIQIRTRTLALKLWAGPMTGRWIWQSRSTFPIGSATPVQHWHRFQRSFRRLILAMSCEARFSTWTRICCIWLWERPPFTQKEDLRRAVKSGWWRLIRISTALPAAWTALRWTSNWKWILKAFLEMRMKSGSSWDSNIIEGCRRVPLQAGITLLFNLTLPVNTAGMQDDSKSRSLVIIVLVLILIFLVANLGYFYWKQRRTMQSVQSQAGLNPAMSIEMQEADASWWGKPAHFRKPFRHVAVLLQELSINCRIHPAWLRGPDLHIVRFVTRRLLFSIIINKIVGHQVLDSYPYFNHHSWSTGSSICMHLYYTLCTDMFNFDTENC